MKTGKVLLFMYIIMVIAILTFVLSISFETQDIRNSFNVSEGKLFDNKTNDDCSFVGYFVNNTDNRDYYESCNTTPKEGYHLSMGSIS